MQDDGENDTTMTSTTTTKVMMNSPLRSVMTGTAKTTLTFYYSLPLRFEDNEVRLRKGVRWSICMALLLVFVVALWLY